MRRWLLSLCALLGCAHAGPELPALGAPGRPPELPAFDAPGRLLLVLETGQATSLHLLDRSGARRVPAVTPREARFVDAASLLVVEALPGDDEYDATKTRMRVVGDDGRAIADVGPPGRHYDAEPSPDGAWLAVGAETPGVGDSDLEIWSLAPPRQRVAVRHQSLEQPRWRQDGMALVASVLMADPETDDDRGGGMLGTSLHWPRLHVVRRDLGDPTLVWDGADSRSLAPGGSLPLWWDEDGIWARQREGLVRCRPIGGCTPVYRGDPARRVVDGRRVGADRAWLVTVEARDAFDRSPPDELLCVDLRSGRVLSRWRAPAGVAVVAIDWIGPPAP